MVLVNPCQTSGDILNTSVNTKPDFECVSCACQRQWLYLLGNEGVVYSETRRRFVGLDAAGVAAYRALDAGVPIEDLKLVGGRSDAASDARLEAVCALTQGIFPADQAADEPQEEWFDRAPTVSTRQACVNIKVHGLAISIVYPPGPWEEICRDCFRECAVSDQPSSWFISAQPAEGGWEIYLNDRRFYSLRNEHQLGLGLMHAVRSLLYAKGDYDVAFHAAMVANDDCGIMLCAPRESGKSTLAACLTARGFGLLADEPALLHLKDWSVSPLHMPISLKEGSWSILQRHLPQVADAPAHLRSDGAKLLMVYPPPQHRAMRSRRLTHIVFPRFAPLSPPEFETLSFLQTLCLLSEGGMHFAKQFTHEDFETLLHSLMRTPSYRLQYTSLEEALQMLQQTGCIEE